MDHLKEGIGLRGYGQKNPLQEYQKEGYDLFEELIRRMEADVVEKLMSVQLQAQPAVGQAQPEAPVVADFEPPMPAAIVDLERRQQQQRAAAGAAVARRRARALAEGRDRAARRAEGGTQRPVSLRQRQEVQEVSRDGGLRAGGGEAAAPRAPRARPRLPLRWRTRRA